MSPLIAKSLLTVSSFGVTSDLDLEDRARITVINSICLGITVILGMSALVFSIFGSYHFVESIIVIPLLLLILYLNQKLFFNISRFVFSYGLLLLIFFIAITNRRTGAEYALIAIACSSAFAFKERSWIIISFVAACSLYIGYLIIDHSYIFYPDPRINYTITSTTCLLLSGTAVFIEMLIFRSIIRKYGDSLDETNKKLNHTNEELNAINESLDMMIKERTSALENKTEELQTQKEKLNEVVIELDHKNSVLNSTILELQQRNYEMDQIIYRLSHNLKAPLCSIAGLCNLMKIDLNFELIEQALPKIDMKIQEMENVFRSVSSLTSTNLEEIRNEEVSLEILVKEVTQKLRTMQGASQVTVTIDPFDSSIISDRRMLSIVFHHIVRNAIMFRNKSQENYLHVAFNQTSAGCRVTFTDNGIGIPDRIREKVFDMFFQGSEQSRGTGLGLYVAREVMRKLKGEIEISSHGPGTKVTVVVPCRRSMI